jgi:DNA-binding FadR family transcriptional regulator
VTAERATDRDLRDAADAHRQIYRAVRARDVGRARRAMDDHLAKARSYQAKEDRTAHAEPRTPNPERRTPTPEPKRSTR